MNRAEFIVSVQDMPSLKFRQLKNAAQGTML